MMKSFVLFLSVFLGVTSYAQQAEALVKLDTLNDRFTYDIRYASTNNFLEEACSLRELVRIQRVGDFGSIGLRESTSL